MLLVRLSLQRRRLYTAGLLVYLAGLSALSKVPWLGPEITPVMGAFAISAVAIVICAALILMAYPLRRLAETSALGLLTAAAASPEWLFASPAGLAAAALLTAVWHVALYGRWWHRLPIRLDWRTSRRFVAPQPAQAVWERLVPDPANPGAHYSGTYLGQEPVPGRADAVIQRTVAGPGLVQETTLDFEEISPPRRIAYDYRSAGGDPAHEYGAGRFELTLDAAPGGTRITFRETVRDLVAPTAIGLWFDDFGGEVRRSMHSALTGTCDATHWLRARRDGAQKIRPSHP